MNALLRPCMLVGLSLLATACSLPEVQTTHDGPSFSLSTEASVAAFEVMLCLEGPVPREVFVDSSITVEAKTSGGAATLQVESLSDRSVEEGTERVELTPEGETLFMWLASDGDWTTSGRRCSAPEVLEFSALGLAEGETLDIDAWSVTMQVSYNAGTFGDGPSKGDLSVEVERID